ncbi:MAG TPA: VWA domain-containing protein [Bryobacteraceae bacterium]|nr:VWA domain-containing protein [Bryobacteraceae bacterium]
MRLAVGFLFAFFISAAAQQVGQNTTPGSNGTATFTSAANLVVETVVVTGKNGKPIENLTANDFTVTENGIPQVIRFFEYQNLPEAPAAAPAPSQPEHITVFDRLGRTQISPAPPGSNRYKDHRLLALYFDMTAMQPPEQMRALAAAKSFIRTQLQASDLIAILRYSGGAVDVLQDFTADRNRLLSIVETLIVGEGQGWDETTSDSSSADTGAAFGQDDTEFNIFNTDRQLSALQTAATMLGRLSEKKSLIYFAGGLRLNGLNNQAQLRATINAAIRAGVSFWPIDARGLVAQAPLGDATKGSPGGIGMYTGASALAVTTNFQQSQDTLYALAGDTGGKALLDYNDLAKGIRQAEQSISSYYIIGYYTSNTALDGKFRRVKISLNNGLSASLDYRQGYYAGKEFSKFTAADKERQLEDALMLGNPITELTIAMEVNYFQLNRAEYFVPVMVKIPGRELALVKRGGGERTLIDFIGEVKDEYGTTITNLRDKVDIKLSGATAIELAKRPIEYDTGFTLLPGKYTIKFLARDAETGRIGTYQTTFVIPNLNKVEKRIPISSVVLSSQRVDFKDALYSVKDKEKKDAVANPLIQDGQKMIPSVTRVFSKGKELYVYLQAYEQGAENTRPLLAFVSFYRAQAKALETQPVKVTNGWNNRVKTMPIEFSIGLNKLQPGKYDCQVTILDPADEKGAFWRAPVVVVP